VHTGIPVGNGAQGVLIWGSENRLCLTVARAGFWDRRGAQEKKSFAERITYAELRDLLVSGQEAEVRGRFTSPEERPIPPYQIAGGQIEISLPVACRLETATLDHDSGVVTIHLTLDGKPAALLAHQAVDAELFWLEMPDALRHKTEITVTPTWAFVGMELKARGVPPPDTWEEPRSGGFIQRLPGDPALAVVWKDRGEEIVVVTALGKTEDDNRLATDAQRLAAEENLDSRAAAAADFWSDYWRSIPRLTLPDLVLTRLYEHGLYRLAGATNPFGPATTLQGPWMEAVRLPLWSNDYHFNINLQMVYSPLLSSGRLGHFAPLWDMMESWLPQLRANGAGFFGDAEALMLPHAVDDRCNVIGGFWQGTIDHASTAWMAKMVWDYYRHGGEKDILRRLGWPLLTGAFNGFWAMAEPHPDDPERLSLPISVSPEYGEGRPGSWGRDASFALAAFHCVARILPDAAAALGCAADSRWQTVCDSLPLCVEALVPPSPWDSPTGRKRTRIALWEGQDLEISHRHHSHLAGIYPFAILSPQDGPEIAALLEQSIRHWVALGAGGWSAWAFPWTACILARMNGAEAAVSWLRWLADTHENEGYLIAAGGTWGANMTWGGADENRRMPQAHEIMQLDANLGVITAIHEILVQSRVGDGGEEIVLLPQIPFRWRDFSFDGIHTVGAFVIGATVVEHRIVEVRVESRRGERLRLRHGIARPWTQDDNPDMSTNTLLERETRPGQRITLRCCAP
jgi:hypothetical protein